jgi:isocitrate lyase
MEGVGRMGREIAPAFTMPPDGGMEWEAIGRLRAAGAVAVHLSGTAYQLRTEPPTAVLVSTGRAVRRLREARETAAKLSTQPLIFACTHAQHLGLIDEAGDVRDRRFLMGTGAMGAQRAAGIHAFCSGREAARRRALDFAPYADVLCFTVPGGRAERFDLREAAEFAAAVRAEAPGKRLGIGVALDPLEQGEGRGHSIWGDAKRDRALSELGFEYRFTTMAGSVAFRRPPEARFWAFLDDAGQRGGATA